MKTIPRIGRLFGIPITIHWSFILLPALTLYWAQTKGADLPTTLLLMGLVFLIFICVVLHELGHALMAKRFGVKTKDIILLPICGIARLESLPKLPKHELLVAIAGPLVNLCLALFLAIPLIIFSNPTSALIHQLSFGHVELSAIPFLLMAFNLAMVVFNLIPIFPMDGGRILRSLLAMKLRQNLATKIAAYVGQFFAILIVIYGFYQNDYTLAFTGFFVLILAAREQRIIAHNAIMNSTPISTLANQNFTPLDQNDSIPFAQNRIAHLEEKFFLILQDRRVIGYASTATINGANKALFIKDVSSFMPTSLDSEASMAEATEVLLEYGLPIIPVIKDNELWGALEMQ